ncbi:hypothetical protein FACS1894172_00550 [Spirochaetia bacterium]|nr:hypothetical protein FACS1894164_07340 [Spirochaetia bacterium]GHU29434.1 hypothetical protein FACS1894172_00550 [Spirochaetia bacterium]
MALVFFSSLSFNLLLNSALCLPEIRKTLPDIPFIQAGILFISIPVLWIFFTILVPFLSMDFVSPFLLFPLSVLIFWALERALFFLVRSTRHIQSEKHSFSPWNMYSTLIFGAVFVITQSSWTIFEVILLSLGFSLGFLVPILILAAIEKRSVLESVPSFLRGTPLFFIIIGLLSLVFNSFIAFIY